MRTRKELVTEIKQAHRVLDRAGIPRKSAKGNVLVLSTRIQLLDLERRAKMK